jgi:hypothetical protein
MECAGKAKRRRRFGSLLRLALINVSGLKAKAGAALRSAPALDILRNLSRPSECAGQEDLA